MKTLNYSTNGNGRLLNPCFADIRILEQGMANIGDRFIINLMRRGEMGIAEVRTRTVFRLGDLTDAVSYCICGKGKEYLTAVLRKMYMGATATTPFMLLTLNYTERFMAVQNEVIQEYWNDQTEQHPHHKKNAHQLTFADELDRH